MKRHPLEVSGPSCLVCLPGHLAWNMSRPQVDVLPQGQLEDFLRFFIREFGSSLVVDVCQYSSVVHVLQSTLVQFRPEVFYW